MLRNHETIIYWGIHELTNLVNNKGNIRPDKSEIRTKL